MRERQSSQSELLEILLSDGAQQLGVVLSSTQRDQLFAYVDLLAKWNTVYNLTAIRDPRQMLIHHILDSLAVVPYLQGREVSTILDVGSGGGLPGIVLAIAVPEWTVTLNDIVAKKSAFQTQVKAELKLSNLSIVNMRVELLRPGVHVPQAFDVVVSRAFTELGNFVALARHLVAPAGMMLAMKGQQMATEIDSLPEGAHVAQLLRLKVPALDAERHLIEVRLDEAG